MSANTVTRQSIYDTITEAAGLQNGCLNGTRVSFEVKEMWQRTGQSVWLPRASGRFQINVQIPGEKRVRIFRTKKADNSFNVLDVTDAIKLQARVRKAADDGLKVRDSTRQLADALCAETKKIGLRNHVSVYGGSSYCTASNVEGKVALQMNFGVVSPEVAMKVFQFAKSLES